MKYCCKYLFNIILLLSIFTSLGCEKEKQNTLFAIDDYIEFESDGGSTSIVIQTDANSWNINNPASDWVELSSTYGTRQTEKVIISVSTSTLTPRKDTLVVSAGTAKPVSVIVSQLAPEYLNTLTTDYTSLRFKKDGDTTKLSINTNAPEWNLSTNVDWLKFSNTTGVSGNIKIDVMALKNTESDSRTATIIINGQGAKTVQIPVLQKDNLYPDYNISPQEPDASGMTSTAVELAEKIHLGWNIGNSLEAIGGETAWGNPLITKSLIDLVKQSGFNAIRIPCSWDQYMINSGTAQIDPDWLNRVKEVVQYCVDNDMYVILNIHWDGGWLENNCTLNKMEDNNDKQKAFWEQIATYLRDFDEHLLFAGANEPNVENPTEMAVLNSYHQTFIDAVRSTGGRNSYRVLVVQGPSTDIEKTNQLMLTLPVDKVSNRLMVEIHFYTPWNFCGMTEDATWGSMFYYWGNGYHSTTDPSRNSSWGEEADVDKYFGLIKVQFVDKGIPVVLGEYAPTRRSSLTGDELKLHLASRAYYLKYVTKQAKANGILPFYWDNGGIQNNSSGIFDRKNNTVFDQQALDALIEGAAK